MQFKSKWITTSDFIGLTPVNAYHNVFREDYDTEIPQRPIKNYHTHFRKKFILQDTKNVCINISADDYYKLYVNGSFVCQGPAPAEPWRQNYNTADISQYLKNGENVIAVHVMYQGLNNKVWFSNDNRQGMIADIYSNGEFLFGTDESWIYSKALEFSGETTGYDTQYLENIDFNLKEKGWKELEFDEKSYKKALVKSDMDYCFADSPAETIDVYKKAPAKIEKIDRGKYFIDFGEEITGQFFMSVTGKRGQKVRVLCGEEEENSIVRYDMRCNCNYDELCILSGEEDVFEFFDYKAFRYVNVFSDEDNLDPDTFCAIVRHHKFEEKWALHTDIPYLKEIWKICSNGVKYGSQESILDCPQREKGAYLGDFTVSGLSHLYLTGDWEYYKKNLYDYAATTKVCKSLMSVANSNFVLEYADYSLQYPSQILSYYNYTKDKKTVSELYPVVCGILEYFKGFEREDGLLENVNEKLNLVDWPFNLRDGYKADVNAKTRCIECRCHNVVNAYYIGALLAVNEIREILGIGEKTDVVPYKKAFIKAFYNAETRLFCDTEKMDHSALHSNALPLLFDITEKEMHDDIRRFIMSRGLNCGVQFACFVLKALGRIGAYEDELALLINEGEHSWVNMLREGATTCFEAWGKDQKENTSFCHPWASTPIIILFEDLNNKFGIEIKSKDN